jgi:hypothetical protein
MESGPDSRFQFNRRVARCIANIINWNQLYFTGTAGGVGTGELRYNPLENQSRPPEKWPNNCGKASTLAGYAIPIRREPARLRLQPIRRAGMR